MTSESSSPSQGAGTRQEGLLHANEALRRILDRCSVIRETERLPLDCALGHVLADDVIAPRDVPPRDNSAMDGYALRAADLPPSGSGVLRLTGRVLAGDPAGSVVAPGECVRIMTGAPIPDGADTVVMREQADEADDFVRIGPGHRPGANIRRRGEDLRVGEGVLARGRRLRPADLGLIASLGLPAVRAFRRPRVALFSTGDELCALGDSPRSGQIFDSNRYSLRGLLEGLGTEIQDLGILPDDPEQLRSTLRESARSADVVLSSGGVSVGDADHVTQVLAELGQVAFWKIAIKPGRPLAFGTLGDRTLFFGLPGNPVAAMVTFIRFVRPALHRIAGQGPEEPLTFEVPCLDALHKAPGRSEFQRGILQRDGSGRLCVGVTGGQGSGMLHSMSQANCLIVLEHDRGPVAAGETVTVQPLPGAW
ncbi:molybdopterin molybdotransferase MoeA [Thioalkalivibrio paradoxus]|uniref:Molybdopterin molybdenumtransferase n=1 Tax=Thioalkalivibrio paradoxus ARh 1 TaxID=713585 RepID=W0DJU3_9GAMM|nr:gephyrin-like molybdotransferase Glp [Thioalkalivibrio paradoxus]AHE97253.1 molybdenum cofactor biosynthesis protein MoaA [Thioalkalivibrio paradoxus ARh 1]